MSSIVQPSRRASLHLPLAVHRRTAVEVGVVTLLTAIAFTLRISQLHQSLLGDEVFTYQDIVGHTFSQVLSTVHTGGENSPPLFFLLAWATAHLGDASVWIRVPSLLAGTAIVPVLYLLGRDVFGRVAGLVAAGILALAPFPVFYGIEARPYATMTFCVAVSILGLVRAVRTGAVGWWVLYVLSAAAAAYTHYTSIFVLGVEAVWSLWACRQRIRPALVANAVIVVLYLPWLPRLRGKALEVIGALYPLGVHRVLTDLLRPIPGHPAAPLRAIPTMAGMAVFAVVVLAGLIAVAQRWRASGSHVHVRALLASPRTLLVVLVFATPVGLLLYSLTVTDLWLPRGLSASMPATAIVLGGLVAALPRPAALVAALAMAVTLFAGTLRSFGPDYNRGPYRTIAAYLDRWAGPRDPVSMGTYAGAGPLFTQFRRPHDILTAGTLWQHIAPGTTGYLVLDEVIKQRFNVSESPAPGFVIVARHHYGGSLATDVVSYRRAPGGP